MYSRSKEVRLNKMLEMSIKTDEILWNDYDIVKYKFFTLLDVPFLGLKFIV